jgi:probable phosphomutase (TIGR03848 family)
MTTFLFIRHAMCEPVGHAVAGRAPGVHLNEEGRIQAERLRDRLSAVAVSAIYSSPLERALETAGPIARGHGLSVLPAPGLIEIDFGHWTGRTLTDLDGVPEWKAFNSFRSGTRIPGGENMAEVLTRALSEVDRMARVHSAPDALVAVVSHGDVLRALIAHFLGISLDLFQRLEVSPASVSVVALEDHGPRVLLLNSTAGWPSPVMSAQVR